MPTTRKRVAHVYESACNETPVSLSQSVLDFCTEYPECEKNKFNSLYIATLTIAYLIDQAPSPALIREFSIANGKLRREVLAQYKDPEDDSANLADLL